MTNSVSPPKFAKYLRMASSLLGRLALAITFPFSSIEVIKDVFLAGSPVNQFRYNTFWLPPLFLFFPPDPFYIIRVKNRR